MKNAIWIFALLLPLWAGAAELPELYPGDYGVSMVDNERDEREVRSIIEPVDVAFEIGDGYYDFLKEDLYLVRQHKRFLGYMRRVFLTYTEDPELAVALVRFDYDGKRVGEIEVIDRLPCDDNAQPLNCIPEGY